MCILVSHVFQDSDSLQSLTPSGADELWPPNLSEIGQEARSSRVSEDTVDNSKPQDMLAAAIDREARRLSETSLSSAFWNPGFLLDHEIELGGLSGISTPNHQHCCGDFSLIYLFHFTLPPLLCTWNTLSAVPLSSHIKLAVNLCPLVYLASHCYTV